MAANALGAVRPRGVLDRHRTRDQHHPTQHLDLDAGDDAAVEPAVSLLERRDDLAGILLAVGFGDQRHRDLVALAAIAHQRRAGLG